MSVDAATATAPAWLVQQANQITPKNVCAFARFNAAVRKHVPLYGRAIRVHAAAHNSYVSRITWHAAVRPLHILLQTEDDVYLVECYTIVLQITYQAGSSVQMFRAAHKEE